MIWPFRRSALSPRTIDAIYGMIVAQARCPAFYAGMGVPDTVNGRFDMVVLHLWAVLRRLREVEAAGLAQALFDRFCEDMDGNLREMGVSDTAVPRRMRRFGEAFYGRALAYDEAMAPGADDAALAAAIGRNVFRLPLPDTGLEASPAGRLADYARAVLTGLGQTDRDRLTAADWRFPAPPQGVGSDSSGSQQIGGTPT